MDDRATLLELRERYLLSQRWADLADTLDRLVRVTEPREERLALYEELGSVSLEHLRDAERAFEAFRVVADLQDDFGDDDALEVFGQILAANPNFFPAFQRVEEVLRRRGDRASFEQLAAHLIDLAEASAHDPPRFLRHQREAARIFEVELGARESALIVLTSSVTRHTWQTGILDDIERLAARTQSWDEPIDRLSEVVAEMTDSESAGRLHKRIGLWCTHAERFDQAMDHLRHYLRHFPADVEAQSAVSGLFRMDGRWDELVGTARRRYELAAPHEAAEQRKRLIAVLEEAAATADFEWDRAHFLAELGGIYRESGDMVTAVSVWEQALALEPTALDAARPLVDHYLERNRWERAAPILETLVTLTQTQRGALTPEEENLRWLQYADVLDRVGNEKLALHAYRQAYELDRNNPKTLERLGMLLHRADELDQAYHVFVQLVDRHERHLDPKLTLDVLRKSAAIKLKHHDPRVARGLIERALRIAPDDREALQLAAEIATAEGDIGAAMEARRRLVESQSNPTIRFKDLVEMGDTWLKQHNVEQAARSYANALRIEPNSVATLRKLLAAFQKLARWREAVGVLERLAALETDPSKRANLFYTMGIIARDEVRNSEHAVTWFERALDDDVEQLKAFEAIDRILTSGRAWKELERAYRRMLHRVRDREQPDVDRKLEVMLWRNLGEVYRSRLGDAEAAAKAFEAALALAPDDEALQRIVAELYERAGIHSEGALARHRQLLAKEPMRPDSLYALYRGYITMKSYDAAHCVAGVLLWLNAADSEASEYYHTYLGRHVKLADGTFFPELLDHIYPREQNRVVNAVMAHLAVALRALVAGSARDYGINPKTDRIDELHSSMVFAQMYRYVAKTLMFVPPPHLFARQDHPLGMRIVNLDPPACLIGSDILHGVDDDREMIFRITKMIAWMRPEHYLAGIGNTAEQLQALFITAMDWALGRKPSMGREGARVLKALKSAPPPSQSQLQSLIRTYVKHADAPPDMHEWLTLAEMSTSRFALTLCGEFSTAAQLLKREPAVMTGASVQQRLTDLVRFATSEPYFELRKELSLAIH